MVSLEYLALVITRRCNEKCEMCMRGNSEEVDMSEEIVNRVLLNNDIQDIETLNFTGGEPTLNEKIICYVIQLVIQNNIPVRNFSIVTNAKKFPKDSLEALNDYQRFTQLNGLRSTIKINFSNDVFHEKHSDVIGEYETKYPQFQYSFKGLDWIWKTGRAEYGEKFEYKILPMYVQIIMGYFWVMNTLYVTAKGNYETMGDGMYLDMDQMNMGSVFDKSLLDLLEQYGELTYGNGEQYKRLLYTYKHKLF